MLEDFSAASAAQDLGPHLDAPVGTFVPHLRLYTEPLLIEDERGRYKEVEAPVISLRFDYGGTSFRSGDQEAQFIVGRSTEARAHSRDFEGEARAQRALESYGAVELTCLEHCETDYDSEADYLAQLNDNVHSQCSFTSFAVSQLREQGWRVEIAPDYPYQVVGHQGSWYASVEPEDEEGDWFSLELGIEIEGTTVNMLPALLDILDGCAECSSLDQLVRVPARFRAVPVGPNTYVTVPPDRLQRLLQAVLELYRGERSEDGALRFSRFQAGSLEGLEPALEEAGHSLNWRGSEAPQSLGRSLGASGNAPRVPPSEGLQATLRSYQEQGLGWLQQLREQNAGGVLADDMGLGKTLQTIAHITAEKDSGRMDAPVLIVMPTSLIGNWKRELNKFAPALKVCVWHGHRRRERANELQKCDVVLTTYPLLCRDIEVLDEQEYYLTVLDEAQAIKNRRSQAHRAVKDVRSRHRLCLTGTPVENNLEELWSLFDFLMPSFLGDLQRFRSSFRDPIEREGSEVRLEALRARLAPFILRRMKEQVAKDLPPKTELMTPVELKGDQRELYENIRVAAHQDVRKAIRSKGVLASTITILDGLMKLRQVCCDPRLVNTPSARAVKASTKYETFMQMVEQQLSEGRHILVFSQFTRMLHLLSRGLEERRIRHTMLTGETANRQRSIDAFQSGDVDVFLISLKAGGTGLNLTRADTVIHYDPWWNAAAQAQATDRAYRIGQTRPVFVYRLIVAGSVEERMSRLQQRKQQLANSVLGAGQSKTQSGLSYQEVEDLFAPLSDG